MAANNILDKQVPVYHRFVDNQVLTDNHLNEVLDHLNFQDKLSRTSLIGVGILCGLKVTPYSDNIVVGKGVAVTTDGDILKHDHTIYKGFKTFKDEHVIYQHFLDSGKTIELYELEEKTTASDVYEISQFQTRTKIAPDKMVALLYLENYDKEEDDCSPVDCNALGKEVVNRLRVLLTSTDNAKIIAAKDSIFNNLTNGSQGDVLNYVQKILPKRVLLNKGNTASYELLKSAYSVNFNAIGNRIKNISQLSVFTSEISKINFNIESFLKGLVADSTNFQYLNDFHKDLCIAFNELIDALEKEYNICCPDPTAFPKHVLLGEVNYKPLYLRHAFYPSPLHNKQQSVNNLKRLFRRIIEMIRKFIVTKKNEIRITPSKDDHFPLGERALPSYYNLVKANQPKLLVDSWHKNDNNVLNYYKYGYPSDSFDPLNFHLEAHDFYRIEGHLGRNVFEAVKLINNKRFEKGLAFEIIPIAVGNNADEETIDYDKYKVFFEDLQTILQAWNEEQKCIVKGSSKFLSGFSNANKGTHIEYVEVGTVNLHRGGTTSPMMMGGMMSEFGGMTGTMSGYQKAGSSYNTKANAVLEGINGDQTSTGSIWQNLINTGSGGSDIELTIKDSLKTIVAGWEPELITAVVDIPALVLGKMKETEDNKLLNIEDFTLENLKKYIKSLKAQCDAAGKAKKLLQSQINKTESKLRMQPYVENYQFILNKLISSCCIIERVKVLYERILQRKKELLGKMVLKEYIKSHPGLEHKGGVKKGGTFVVLYHSITTSTKENLKELDELFETPLPPSNKNDNTIKETSGFVNMRDKPQFINMREEIKFPNFNSWEDLKEKLPDFSDIFSPYLPYLPNESVGHGVVIGDLCLPYVCCSDMPSVTFVFPDQEVDLFIGKDFVCKPFDGNADPVLLQVTPVDADIKAFNDGSELTDVVTSNGSNFYFDANKLDEKLYGETITFTVNDQNVAPTIKVYQKPLPSFSIAKDLAFINKNTAAKITIDNTSTPINGQQFTWDFGVGEAVTQNALKFEHTYKVIPGESYEFKIVLTAENGPCNNTDDDLLTFKVPEAGGGADCKTKVETLIVTGKNAIEEEIRKNSLALNKLTKFYTAEMKPIYDLIQKDIGAVLEGKQDTKLFAGMLSLQKNIMASLNPNMKNKEKEFMLRLFYENILIYFYIQACRETSIISQKKITTSWINFTNNASDTYIEVFAILLKKYPIHDALKGIIRGSDKRLSKELKASLETMIKTMESVLV